MILWSYDDCRDLCPVRHLLSYVHLCGIKDGFLFPNLKKRSDPLDYASVMNTINNSFKHILNNDVKLTTHSFRKMFAMWGGMDLQQAKVAFKMAINIYTPCGRTLNEETTRFFQFYFNCHNFLFTKSGWMNLTLGGEVGKSHFYFDYRRLNKLIRTWCMSL
jgi:hypothetical protein